MILNQWYFCFIILTITIIYIILNPTYITFMLGHKEALKS